MKFNGIRIPTAWVSIKDGEVTPKTIKNEHCIQPFGAKKGRIVGSDHCCSITLSEKSEDGLTFSYISTLPLTKGSYVFQDNFCKHSYITDFTETQVTFSSDFQDMLENGSGVYTRGLFIDCEIPNWQTIMYLWGMILSVREVGTDILPDVRNDFIELAIVDKNDLFSVPEIVGAVFGCTMEELPVVMAASGFEWSEEYGGHWTKYYDESFALNYVNRGEIKTPDGSPGGILSGLFIRCSYFRNEISSKELDIYVDHLPTSKDTA